MTLIPPDNSWCELWEHFNLIFWLFLVLVPEVETRAANGFLGNWKDYMPSRSNGHIAGMEY
jgi:hypothetical protein